MFSGGFEIWGYITDAARTIYGVLEPAAGSFLVEVVTGEVVDSFKVGAAMSEAACGGTYRTPTSSSEQSLPNWVENPPADHYVGRSECLSTVSQNYLIIKTYADAIKNKCPHNPDNYKIEFNFFPSAEQTIFLTCGVGGQMAISLFRSDVVNCSLIR